MNYQNFFKDQLSALKNEGRYRVFADLERLVGNAPYALWHNPSNTAGVLPQEVVVWCSNDYLGMSHHPEVIQAMVDGARHYGAGSGGTRNISGTSHSHVLLEQEVANLHGKEQALIFMSGYVANDTTLYTLGTGLSNCVFFSDEKNHASIIRGVKSSNAKKEVFRHHDMDHLESLLKLYPKETPKIIITVSVASMDGDFPPLSRMCDLAETYGALTYLDEVHGVGVYGHTGAGVAQYLNISHRIDIIQGNFAKGYGVVGGYIAGSHALVDYVRSHASGFIFTTSLPPAVTEAARASIRILREVEDRRALLWLRVNQLKAAFEKSYLPYLNTPSHIVPLIVGDPHKCRAVADYLLTYHNIYIQPINYPTVPRGSERFRITITPDHTEHMIEALLHALEMAWNEFHLPYRNDKLAVIGPLPIESHVKAAV